MISVLSPESNKTSSSRERNRSPSNSARRSSGNHRSITRPSQFNQTDLKSLNTNGNTNHAKHTRTELSNTAPLHAIGYKNKNNISKDCSENIRDGGNEINIRVDQFCDSTKASPSTNKIEPQERKAIDCNKTLGSDKKTTSKVNSSKSKNATLEVEWTHLKTPPRGRKLIHESPSQNNRSNKSLQSSVPSNNRPLEKTSSNRKVVHKARTTNLALSMKIAGSANILHKDAKHEKENNKEKLSKVTKRKGTCGKLLRVTNI